MKVRLYTWICALVLLGSCSPSDRYWGVCDLSTDRAWLPSENVVFEFATIAGRGDRIELFVRTQAKMGNEPLVLVVKTARADGLFWQDTVRVTPKTTWGVVYEARAMVRRGVEWKEWETLSIGVRPAGGPIDGVAAVGLFVDGAAAIKQKE